MQISQKPKIIYIEVLRALATFSVILLHCISSYFSNASIYATKTWWAVNIINSITRFGVPIFFMISGFLVLSSNSTNNIFDFYKKRLTRILIPFLGWNIVYYLFYIYDNKTSFSITELFTLFIHKEVSYHFWFVYILVFIYLFSPFIKKIMDNCSIKQLLLLLLLIIFPTTIRPVINKTFNIWIAFFDPVIEGYVGYFILGYILGKFEINKIYRYAIYLCGFFSVLITIFGTYYLSNNQSIEAFFNGGYQFNSYFIAASIFIFTKNNLNESIVKTKDLFIFLGKYSYGVYLIHVLVLDKIGQILGVSSVYIQIPLYALLTMLISYILIYIINFLWRLLSQYPQGKPHNNP